VYGQSPHAGRGGWTWYTGSAGWLYRLLHEVVLGIERQADMLRFRPRVPATWPEFKVHYRYYQTFYHLVFTQDPSYQGPIQLKRDGRSLPGETLQLENDQREHTVEVRFGPMAVAPGEPVAELVDPAA
jgi:cyclic beta-1,2-glucan synthetase